MKNWVNDLDENGGDHVVKVLLGNKSDLEDKRAVSYEEAKVEIISVLIFIRKYFGIISKQ